ncbi:hypothetical protein P3W85_30655 [Cupriavidus basilensis]|uniref:Uncharacterized protein n=1 Tax=Cupriavidus basilensis TaxID=68895 RepID=A0ABT6AXD3_9BURK|nr:hypothetical protein [Cupriavidus basilensis]MDF3837280.1 hypothetical protein [Cupriavidus basilensis]
MYRLTRLVFSPWTYLVTGTASLGILVLYAALLGFMLVAGPLFRFDWSHWLGSNSWSAAISWGIYAGPTLTLAGLLMFAVRAILVKFLPRTRPWVYFGPPPTAASSPMVSTPVPPRNTPASVTATPSAAAHDVHAAAPDAPASRAE